MKTINAGRFDSGMRVPRKPVGKFGRWLSGDQLIELPSARWASTLTWMLFIVRRSLAPDLGFIMRVSLVLTVIALSAAVLMLVISSSAMGRLMGFGMK